MTVDFRSQASARDVAPTVRCDRPAGTTDGDVMLLYIIAPNGITSVDSIDRTWTPLDPAFVSDGSSILWVLPYWRRIEDVDSEDAYYDVVLSDGWSAGYTVYIAAYSGVDPDVSNPIVESNWVSSQSQGYLAGTFTGGEGGDEAVFLGAVKAAVSIDDMPGWHRKQEMGNTYGSWIAASTSLTSGANGSFFTEHSGSSNCVIGYSIVLGPSVNAAPSAPTLNAPAENQSLNLSHSQTFRWTTNDEPWDSQYAYQLRYRIVGSSTWTYVGATTPLPQHTFDPGTFTAGNYEWQVWYDDTGGNTSPWSSSGHFTAAAAPAGPAITAPTGNQIVGPSETVTWTVLDQDKYQVRTVADSGGAPDTATIYYDSGELVSTTVRELVVAFGTNDRFEHVQVRIEDGGLWSPWDSVRVQVDYVDPPVPTFTLTADDTTASIEVNVTNPTPVGAEPTVTHNSVWVDDGDGFVRRTATVSYNGSWTYWTPVSGRVYDTTTVYVVAHGDNGATSQSA